MKRTRRTFRAMLLVALIALAGRLDADIIILRSGEKKEGTIIAEDDLSVTLRFHLTTKLKDWIKILRVDIKEIIRQTPAQVEFAAKRLDRLLPTPDLLSVSDYEDIIQDNLRTFLVKHPGTPEAKKVEEMIEILTEEKIRVHARGIKMWDRWLSAAEAKREEYEIDAYRQRLGMWGQMKNVSADHGMPREIGALRRFENLRTNFPASLQYLQAIPEVLDILDKYGGRLSAMGLELPVRNKQRREARAQSDQAREMMDREERGFRARVDTQIKAGEKWRDVARHDEKSIRDAEETVARERKELSSIDLAALKTENEMLSEAIRLISDGNAAGAREVMARLEQSKAALLNKKTFEELKRKLKDLPSL